MRSVLFLAFLSVTAALYDSNDDVIELTPSNFKEVTSGKDVWLVEFYAPWCGHCKNLAPAWKKAAKALKGIAKVGAVDMDAHQAVGQPYGIQGFPTIKIFEASKTPTDYKGAREAKALVDAALAAVKKVAYKRIGEKASDGPKSDDVVELTDANFNELVLQSNDIWMVEFFAPWCGHCKNLAPEWAKAATKLKKSGSPVKLGAVDATVHGGLAERYEIRGYPTIKVFGADKSNPEVYEGARTASAIVDYAEEMTVDVSVDELISQEKLDECMDKQVCFIAFLPHILDTGAEGRNNYLEMLHNVAHAQRKKPFSFMWTESMQHADLENVLDVGGAGYPALAIINRKKSLYAGFKSSFSEEGINSVANALGKERWTPYSSLPTLATVEPWDGKDGELPHEDL